MCVCVRLRRSVFEEQNLSISTKRLIYNACVLSTIVYSSECRVLLQKDIQSLECFHNRCVHSILGIFRQQQWTERISSEQCRQQWGGTENTWMKIMKRRQQWLGHTARMPYHCIPKTSLLGWLPQKGPRCGPNYKKR